MILDALEKGLNPDMLASCNPQNGATTDGSQQQPQERGQEQQLLATVRANNRDPGLAALKRLLEMRLQRLDSRASAMPAGPVSA
jgi:hypothetical protein